MITSDLIVLRMHYFKLVYFSFLFLGAFAKTACLAESNPPPPSVMVILAEETEFSKNTEFVGRIEAVEKVNVIARISGILGPRQFTDGQWVRSGQTIFLIEPDQYQLSVNKQKAVVQGFEAALVNAKVQLNRAKILVASNAISKSEYDRLAAEEMASAARLQEAKVNLDEAELKLSWTRIQAPIDGRIGKANFTPGNMVGPESKALATIVYDKTVRILFPVTTKQLLEYFRKKENSEYMKVDLVLSDGSILQNAAKLDFLDVVVDPKTDTAIARATAENKGSLLFDGEVVHVSVARPSTSKVILIPYKSIAIDNNGAYCLVVDDDNKIVQRVVKVGSKKQNLIEIQEGLKPGEKVILAGIQKLKPGTVVNATIIKE